MTITKSKSVALPPVGTKCLEAHHTSSTHYIPCGQPATRLIWSGDHDDKQHYAIPMCASCAQHSVKNRRMKLVHMGEPYNTLLTVEYFNRAPARNSQTTDEQLEIEEAPAAESEGELSKITKLAEHQVRLMAEIEELSRQLELKHNELKINQEVDLPEAMTAAGVESGLKITGGHVIDIQNVVAAGITKANQGNAFAWLEDHGRGSLIKRVITIEFGKGEEAWANKFMADLAKRKKKVKATVKMAVHGQTLGKFVRDNDALDEDDEDKINMTEEATIKVEGHKTPVKLGLTIDKLLGIFRVKKAVVAVNAPKTGAEV